MPLFFSRTAGTRRAALLALGLAAAFALAGGSEGATLAAPTKLAKLDSVLAGLSISGAGSTSATTGAAAKEAGVRMSGDNALVVVESTGAAATARNAVTEAGGRITGTSANLVRAWVPLRSLVGLAESDGVRYVRRPLRPVPAGAFMTAGALRAHALSWNRSGATGAGTKIAVVDVGFKGVSDAIYYPPLPTGSTTQDYCDGALTKASDHGASVAQIVHDVAPGAALTLICVADEVGLAQAEAYAQSHGIDIVVHAVSWPGSSRGDGSGAPGSPDAIVAAADAAGILWVNAAGNAEKTHWSGTFTDADHDNIHEFSPALGGESTSIYVQAGKTGCVYLKWDDWPASDVDYDLFVSSAETGRTVGYSDNLQNGTQAPLESVCFDGTSSWNAYPITIRKINNTASSPKLDLVVIGGTLGPYSTAGSSILEPASSPHALSVGAFCTGQGTVEDYSSRGPTIDGRTAPDISAPAGGQSYDVSPNLCQTVADSVHGTSIAAAYAAGAAALVLNQNPGYGPADLRTYLTSHAEEAGPAGPDNDYGAGRLALPSFGPETLDFEEQALADGNYLVTILGDSIGDATAVDIGGVPARSFTVDSDWHITASAGDNAVSGPIVVHTPDGTADTERVQILLTGIALNADRGPIGSTISIRGSGLMGTTEVTLDEEPVDFTVISGRRVDFVVPQGATSGKVGVTILGGSSAETFEVFTVTDAVKPSIIEFQPASGHWGDELAILGDNFIGTSSVKIGKLAITDYEIRGDRGIYTTIPAGAATGPITVTNLAGSTTTKLSFLVTPSVTSVTPTSAKVGDPVQIVGTAFGGTSSVTFGKGRATFTVTPDGTTINTVVPKGATSAAITIKTPGGTVQTQSFTIVPTIASFSPRAAKPGRTIKLIGGGLADTISVTVGVVPATFHADEHGLRFQVPTRASTGVVRITTPAGTVTSTRLLKVNK